MPDKPVYAKIPGQCPTCDGTNIERLARERAVEKFFYPLLGLWPYRCNDCDLKFLDYRRLPVQPRSGLRNPRSS